MPTFLEKELKMALLFYFEIKQRFCQFSIIKEGATEKAETFLLTFLVNIFRKFILINLVNVFLFSA